MLVACVVIAAGCAGIPLHPDPPEVQVSDLNLIRFGLIEQHYRVGLRIRNPNAYSLPIKAMRYELTVNEIQFAHGWLKDPVTVPAHGEAVVKVEVISHLVSFLSDLAGGMEEDPGRISYGISGEIHLTRRSIRIPFEQKGEILLSLDEPGMD
jgi:LEA14-like dessication related protein